MKQSAAVDPAQVEALLATLSDKSTVPIRKIRREVSKRLLESTANEVFRLALDLLNTSVPRFFTYELVQHHAETARSLNARKLEQLGRGLDSWGAVDCFACFLSGPAWRELQVPDQTIAGWARSKDRWWRRAAVVSTVPLNLKARGGRGDTKRTLKICRLVVADHDDMVVKALSWSLRELSRRDPRAVEKFLVEHQQVLAARVLREVNHKLKTGLKNPRARKSK